MTEALRALEKVRNDAVEKARSLLAHERALLAQADALVKAAALHTIGPPRADA